MLFLFFFSALCEWGGWVLKSAENSALFFFFFFNPSLSEKLEKEKEHLQNEKTALNGKIVELENLLDTEKEKK